MLYFLVSLYLGINIIIGILNWENGIDFAESKIYIHSNNAVVIKLKNKRGSSII